jgi:hypothetical protein
MGGGRRSHEVGPERYGVFGDDSILGRGRSTRRSWMSGLSNGVCGWRSARGEVLAHVYPLDAVSDC